MATKNFQSKNWYFSHDKNARNDSKIKFLINKFGIQGYAHFFMLLEVLAESKDYKIDRNNEIQMQLVASELYTTTENVKDFVFTCVGLGLLEMEDDKYFYSQRLSNHLNLVDETSKKRTESLKKNWEKRKKEEDIEDKAQKGSSSAKMEKRFMQSLDDDVVVAKPKAGYSNLPEKKAVDRAKVSKKTDLAFIEKDNSRSMDLGLELDIDNPKYLGSLSNQEIEENGVYHINSSGEKVFWDDSFWKTMIIRKNKGKVSEQDLWALEHKYNKELSRTSGYFLAKRFSRVNRIVKAIELLNASIVPFDQTNKSEKSSQLCLYYLFYLHDIDLPEEILEQFILGINRDVNGLQFKITNLLNKIISYLKSTKPKNLKEIVEFMEN